MSGNCDEEVDRYFYFGKMTFFKDDFFANGRRGRCIINEWKAMKMYLFQN